ncbi:Uncharacterized protein APZ42_031900 [Daphnia magna]|uniref:Uncharacterized protein n=1 Tax=Daphnia magna TaxID=35525 RepID=A0A164MD35_9CRUS|nr:Uncharacterized protein APZ42_031900 [Daphnia magna]
MPFFLFGCGPYRWPPDQIQKTTMQDGKEKWPLAIPFHQKRIQKNKRNFLFQRPNSRKAKQLRVQTFELPI